MTSPLPEAGPQPLPKADAEPAVVMERPHPLTPLVKGWIGLVGLVVYFGRDAVEHLNDPERPDARLLWALAGVGGTLRMWTTLRSEMSIPSSIVGEQNSTGSLPSLNSDSRSSRLCWGT